MRVLTIVPFYYPSAGGVERTAQAISEGLVARRNSVSVWTSNVTSTLPATRLSSGTVIINGVEVTRFNTILVRSIPQTIGAFTPGMARAWLRRDLPFDIVHLHVYSSLMAVSQVVAPASRRMPVVISTHTGFDTALPRGLFDLTLGRLLLRKATRLICATTEEASRFEALGVESERISVIPGGVDVGRFTASDGGSAFRKEQGLAGRYILYAGRLAKNKGLGTLVRGTAPLLARDRRLALVLIGPDAGEARILARIAEGLGVGAQVRIVGEVASDSLTSAMGGAEVFVLPSTSGEAQGLVVLEAMAAGAPVIASRAGGIRHFIEEGVTGMLVEPGNHLMLGNLIERLLADRAFAHSIAVRGNRSVRNWDWSRIVSRTEDLYADAIRSIR